MNGVFSLFNARRSRAGMSVLEYSLLIAAILAALLSVQVYLRRAISYKWRDAADSFGLGRQYETDGSKATTVVRY
ncbi:MAG: hypothetical protein PHH75_04630 [Candidatus Omnitrophica bacterium]|nr:hypothetical protein [Candidatus Omnitrophota bacterium]MDD5574446.1 hypothetical protein [Candidatus Omnitrophota bacterium]